MKIEKIALIDPIDFRYKWRISTHHIWEPLGIECIGSLLKKEGYNVKIFQQQYLSNDEFLKKILVYRPELVGFTSYSFNFHHALNLAKEIKKELPHVKIIFGGYHITFCLKELIENPCIDFAVRGEGELSMLELTKFLDGTINLKKDEIKGIDFFDEAKNKLVTTLPRERIKDFSILPFALRSEEILRFTRLNGFIYPPPSQQKNPALIFATRGCPYNCGYCVSPRFYGRYVTYRTPESVVEEIKYVSRKFRTNVFYFTDLTFNFNKNYVKDLCKRIIRKKIRVNWYALCRIENFDEETVKLMKEAGCSKVGVGIESVSPAILKHIHRNNRFERVIENIHLLNSYGIIVRATFMYGFPWDTPDIYEATLDFLLKYPVDEIRIAIFTPYPGCEFFEKYRNHTLDFDYRKYDSQTPVIYIPKVEHSELINWILTTYRKFYSSSQYKDRIKQKIRSFPHLEESWFEFSRELAKKGWI